MDITFVLNSVGIAGGVRVVLETANTLTERGHKVSVVVPAVPRRDNGSRLEPAAGYVAKRLFRRLPPAMVEGKFNLRYVPDLSWHWLVPKGDAVIATWWETAEDVAAYPESKGRKFYLIQHYEIWGGPRERVEATYRLPLQKIVYAGWLKELLWDRFREKCFGPWTFGVNRAQFFYEPTEKGRDRRIGMMYSSVNWKGSRDGVEAFLKAKQKFPEISLVLFGSSYPGLEVPRDAEFYYNPSQDFLRRIYSSCAVWLSPSWYEGGPIPPHEAMACRCAVAATTAGNITEHAKDGENILLSPPFEPVRLADNLMKLLGDSDLRNKIAQNGYERVQSFTWERAAEQLERILLSEEDGTTEVEGLPLGERALAKARQDGR